MPVVAIMSSNPMVLNEDEEDAVLIIVLAPPWEIHSCLDAGVVAKMRGHDRDILHPPLQGNVNNFIVPHFDFICRCHGRR